MPISTHDVRATGGTVTKRYLSRRRGEQAREWAALHLVHRHQPGLAPRPLAAGPRSLTMSRLPGEFLATPLSAAQIGAMGIALRRLWSVPVGGFAAAFPWRDALPYAERLVAASRPAGGAMAAAHDAARAWWRGPEPGLLRQPPEHPLLGHGDPNLANYLWDGTRIRIVDFENAAVSDAATELALLTEHLSARGADLSALCAALDPDPRRYRAARRLWAIFWLSLFLPGGPATRRNPPGAAARQAYRVLALLG